MPKQLQAQRVDQERRQHVEQQIPHVISAYAVPANRVVDRERQGKQGPKLNQVRSRRAGARIHEVPRDRPHLMNPGVIHDAVVVVQVKAIGQRVQKHHPRDDHDQVPVPQPRPPGLLLIRHRRLSLRSISCARIRRPYRLGLPKLGPLLAAGLGPLGLLVFGCHAVGVRPNCLLNELRL